MLAKPGFSAAEDGMQVYSVRYYYGWPRVGHLATKDCGALSEPSFWPLEFGCHFIV